MYNNIALLLGHLVGDFVLQSDGMASNKQDKGPRGVFACLMHCGLYAITVAAFVVLAGWRYDDRSWYASALCVYGIAFVCHYPIDRWALAGRWSKLFRQTQVDKIPYLDSDDLYPGLSVSGPIYMGLRQYFWAPVLIAVDNAMHLVLMWLLLSYYGAA